jgi:hypothetical protein
LMALPSSSNPTARIYCIVVCAAAAWARTTAISGPAGFHVYRSSNVQKQGACTCVTVWDTHRQSSQHSQSRTAPLLTPAQTTTNGGRNYWKNGRRVVRTKKQSECRKLEGGLLSNLKRNRSADSNQNDATHLGQRLWKGDSRQNCDAKDEGTHGFEPKTTWATCGRRRIWMCQNQNHQPQLPKLFPGDDKFSWEQASCMTKVCGCGWGCPSSPNGLSGQLSPTDRVVGSAVRPL